MREGASQPTGRNQTKNADRWGAGVRPCAPRFTVERETARTAGQGPEMAPSVQ